MNDQVPNRFGNRIWTERAVFATVIAGIGIWMGVSQLTKVPHAVLVNGKPLVNVESLGAAKRLLNDARRLNVGNVPGDRVRFHQNVTIRPVGKDAEITDMAEAGRKLGEATTVEAEAYAIVIDRTPIVALADRSDSEQALKLVKENYERKLGGHSAVSTFKEDTHIDKRYVSADKLCESTSDAVRILTSAPNGPTMHTVKLGDRAAKLAIQYKVPLADMKRMNPQADLDHLHEGDQLIMQVAKAPLTVISKIQSSELRNITPPSGLGRYGTIKSGRRQANIVAIYENGEKVSEEIISQVTTWDRPKTQPDQYDGQSDYSDGSRRSKRHWRHYRSQQQ